MSIAAVQNTTPQPALTKISLDRFADLMEKSQVTEELNLGAALVIKARHAQLGDIILVNTAGDEHALIQ